MPSGASASMLRPTRSRVLQELSEPASAAAVARRLKMPRQQVGYHLKQLEREGLVEVVGESRRGNCIERIVRASARSYLVSAEALASLASDPATAADRFSAGYLIAAAARSIREVAVLSDRAEKAGKRLATLTLQSDVRFRTAQERHRFAEELGNAVAALVARYNDEEAPAGRRFRLLLGLHPAPAPAPVPVPMPMDAKP